MKNLTINMNIKRPTLIDGIETGLNIIAQDLLWKRHTQKDIDDFINRFKFVKKE